MEAVLEKSNLSPALIDKANEAEQLLAIKIEACKGLTINGIEDKEGYKAVRAARLELKDIRIDIEKSFKADRDKLNVFVNANRTKEKELLSKITPIESQLQLQEKAVDDEKEKIKAEEDRKANERIQIRIDSFSKYNYAIDFIIVKGMTDEQYENELTRVKDLFFAEQQKEQLKKEQEEREKIAEENRIAAIKKEQEAEAKRLSEERAKLKAEQDKVAKEQAEREAKIAEARDKIDAEKKAIEDAKRKEYEEAERKIREEKIRVEAAEKAVKDAEMKAKAEAEAKATKEEAERKEKERQDFLRPDKEKLTAFAKVLKSIQYPDLKTREAKKLLMEINGVIDNAVELIESKSSSL